MKIKNLMLIILLCSMVTSGCATTGGYAQSEIRAGYNFFFDANNEYRIVERNNDLWVDKLDGSEKRKITNTPNTEEIAAYITKDGNNLIYSSRIRDLRYFYQSINGDDSNRREISFSEYDNYRTERMNQKRGR